MKRQPSRPGLSYLDANAGRLVTQGPDVLDIKSEIEARWGDVISCFFDTHDEEWVLVEHCSDGVDRHVLSTKKLGQWVIDKLHKIDQAAHVQGDLNHKYELEDEQRERELDHQVYEEYGEAHERLLSALRKDGIGGIPKVFFSGGKAA